MNVVSYQNWKTYGSKAPINRDHHHELLGYSTPSRMNFTYSKDLKPYYSPYFLSIFQILQLLFLTLKHYCNISLKHSEIMKILENTSFGHKEWTFIKIYLFSLFSPLYLLVHVQKQYINTERRITLIINNRISHWPLIQTSYRFYPIQPFQ